MLYLRETSRSRGVWSMCVMMSPARTQPHFAAGLGRGLVNSIEVSLEV
jgi:hypothetical protein